MTQMKQLRNKLKATQKSSEKDSNQNFNSVDKFQTTNGGICKQ